MIKLFYSNDAAYLARLLSQNLDEERPTGAAGLFKTGNVLVPNQNVASFLKLELAKAKGICANVQFSFLDAFLSRLLPSGKTLVDRDFTRYLLVQYFLESRGMPERLPAEVRTYLGIAGSSGNNDVWVYQLADRLARYYHEYTLARPRMLDQWMLGKVTRHGDQAVQETEKWQQKLWSALFGPQGTLAALSQPDAAYHRFDELPQLLENEVRCLPGQIHLFGFSYLSRTHNRILKHLATRTGLSIYTVNPCMEFWEDVLTPAETAMLKQHYLEREKRKRLFAEPESAGEDGIEDPYHLEDRNENAFLQHWGRPGRENIHILNDMVASDFSSGFINPFGKDCSLLAKIQLDILNRTIEKSEPLPVGYAFVQDRSIRILKCPEIRREVEIIANEIWDLMCRDEESGRPREDRLRFNEIAVIIANSAEYDSYATHISSVFHEIHDIPHTVSDLSPDSNRIVEGIEILLSLPVNAVTRSELLRLLTHPAFLNRFPGSDAEEWVGWCQDLAIHHGESREDHRETYIEKDLYNWDQGLRRLALGSFLEGTRSNEDRAYEAGGHWYLPQDVGQGSLPNAARFIALIRSLLADRAYARSASLTLAEWSGFLQAMIKTYLRPEASGDERVMNRCLAAIAGLARLDLKNCSMSYTLAREFALTSLKSVSLVRGAYLADGVVVTSFLPMRPVPFKVVFIAGMGEGCFPAREMRDPLDLRTSRRFAGDVTPRERDQYNFLETLVSTREFLRLSYVSRDSQTGESLEPSSIIKELQFILEDRYRLSGDDLQTLVIEHPLRRYDERYFSSGPATGNIMPNYSREAWQEAGTVKLRRSLREALAQAGMPGAGTDILQQYAKKYLSKLLYPVAMPAGGHCDGGRDVVTVPIHSMRKFLECPLQGWASFHLGLREEETRDPRSSADEILASEKLDASAMQQRAFVQSRGKPDAGAACGQEYHLLAGWNELKGIAPTGIFLETEKRRHFAEMSSWQENYDALKLSPDPGWHTIRFGSGSEHDEADLAFPALQLELIDTEGRQIIAEVSGTLKHLSPDLDRFLMLSGSDDEPGQRQFLSPFVAYMVLLASGRLPAGSLDATVITRKTNGRSPGLRSIVFSGREQEEARKYLGAVVSDLLFRNHAYLLPVEAVIEHHWKGKKDLEDIVEDLKEGGPWKSYSSRYGPVAHPEDYGFPGEETALRIIEARYGPWLSVMPREWK